MIFQFSSSLVIKLIFWVLFCMLQFFFFFNLMFNEGLRLSVSKQSVMNDRYNKIDWLTSTQSLYVFVKIDYFPPHEIQLMLYKNLFYRLIIFNFDNLKKRWFVSIKVLVKLGEQLFRLKSLYFNEINTIATLDLEQWK